MRALLFTFYVLLITPSFAADTTAAFDAANKLYEQGKYAEAAKAYEEILQTSKVSPAVYFNLANSYFKAGKSGRAMYYLHRAERLAPRDPDIQGNLQFIRSHVYGGKPPELSGWRSVLHKLSLDEWAKLAGVSLWLWCTFLCLGKWREPLKRALGGYTALAGCVFLGFSGALFAAAYDRNHTKMAVVIASESTVRYGPLEESQTAFTVRDGMELTILDRKDKWLQVATPTEQIGWLPEDKVIQVN